MPVKTISATNENPRIHALRQRHAALSQEVEDARKSLSTTDFYLNQLKKLKLLVKEEIMLLEQDIANQGSEGALA